jgi:hypothetical protein
LNAALLTPSSAPVPLISTTHVADAALKFAPVAAWKSISAVWPANW